MNFLPKILLADDDQEDYLIISEAFNEIKFTGIIDWVQNGERVLEVLHDMGENNLPSLIVLDLNMPLLNGTQTLKRLKEHPRFQLIPVVIFSTSVNPIEKAACMEAGAELYATKPNTYQESILIARQFQDLCEMNVASAGKG